MEKLEHKHLDIFVHREGDGLLVLMVKTLRDHGGFETIARFEGAKARDIYRTLTGREES